MPKQNVHRRGGIYRFEKVEQISDWSGNILSKEILNYLMVDDVVRLLFQNGFKSYVKITDILPNGFIKGIIDDPYNVRYCNGCYKGSEPKHMLYCCPDLFLKNCNFDCHLDCLQKNPQMKKCDCKLERNIYGNNQIIIFHKSNISEIPNWSSNTEKLIKKYTTQFRVSGKYPTTYENYKIIEPEINIGKFLFLEVPSNKDDCYL